MFSRNLLWWMILGISCAHANEAPPSEIYTLLETGIHRTYGLRTQELKQEQASLRRWNAWSALLPTVSVSGGRSFNKAQSLSSGNKLWGETNSGTLGLSAEWMLWNNFKNIRDVKLAGIDLDIERTTSFNEAQNFSLNLINQYMDLQLLFAQKDAQNDALTQAKLLESEAHELVRLGAKTQLDAMDTEIQRMNQERDVQETDYQIRSAERALRLLVYGEEASEHVFEQTDLTQHRPYYLDRFLQLLPTAQKIWRERARERSPDARLSMMRLDRSLEELHQTRIGYLPSTSFKISHAINLDGHLKPNSSSYEKTSLNSFTVELLFSWEVWNWFSTYRAIQVSEKDYQINRLKTKETLQRVEIDTQNALETYETATRSADLSRMALERAIKQNEYSLYLYQLGKLSLLQAQTALQRLKEAKISYAQRMKNQYVSAARILYQMGEDLAPDTSRPTWLPRSPLGDAASR